MINISTEENRRQHALNHAVLLATTKINYGLAATFLKG